MVTKKEIPTKFLTGDVPPAHTVGELIAQLSELPPNLIIRGDFGADDVQVSVMQCDRKLRLVIESP